MKDNLPIPYKNYTWCTIKEGYKPGDSIGIGRTEQDAINDLERQENEHEEL